MPANYLLRRSGQFYFRVRVPLDLRRWFGRRGEIKRSLKTHRCEDAKTAARAWLYRTERLFSQIRSGTLTDEQIKKLVTEYLGRSLREAEETRLDGGCLLKDDEDGAEAVSNLDGLEMHLADLREDLAKGRYERAAHVADTILEGAGIKLDKGSREYRKLCGEALKAVIEGTSIEIERMKGNYGNRLDRAHSCLAALTPSPSALPSPAQGTAAATAGKPGRMLSEVIKEYLNECASTGKWKNTLRTGNEVRPIFKLFVRIVGDRDIKTLKREDVAGFKSALREWPANANKKAAYGEGKSAAEVIQTRKTQGDKPMSDTTVLKHLRYVKPFLEWVAGMGHMAPLYLDGLIEKGGTKREKKRAPYSKGDIEKLMAYLPRDRKRPERFWVPLIALFTGARQGEICQLYVKDIEEEDGIPHFHFRAEEQDQSIKTSAGWRKVPIHPVLMKLGLMEYVDALRKGGGVRLWERLKYRPAAGGYGALFEKWYGRDFNRKHITDDPKKVFHSFRNTVINALKQAGVEMTLIKEIVGHEGKDMTADRYPDHYGLGPRRDALLKLDYGLDVAALLPKWTEIREAD